jgi:hypothetical protein
MNEDSVYVEALEAALTELGPSQRRIVQRVIEIVKSEPDSAKAMEIADRVLAEMNAGQWTRDDGKFVGRLLAIGCLLAAPLIGVVATLGAALVAITIAIFLRLQAVWRRMAQSRRAEPDEPNAQ